ncbi:GH25 family lysozyme [Arthrobacter sp. FW306-2-2C-D06B]|uniref:GH25 family lysozyme n=1 Tax=Arthrobacter sp. FW306-2-2C-D06B TaxID=2879618 RepID=UPI001F238E37|nr:GH25 family lysozyme [Arthrobacter sp. FW306-2-2C-D06B]UKA57521.1 lysozyme M1 [Arthrobacter sp. FW306-2-2C-D06B]
MRDAIPAGGAEMGQRSPRVMADKKVGLGSIVAGSRAVPETLSLTVPQATDPSHWRPSYGIAGQDVSAYQGAVDWASQWNQGSRFAYVKATEGNYYQNENFSQQYDGSRSVGMIRGSYHFAIPNWSSGADQARYFVANGGGWTADGYTLPPVLDIEYNPYEGQTINGFYFGNTCYGMSAGQMASWVADFGNTVKSLIGRYPVIYSTTDWWTRCTGNAGGFTDYPLWIASYPSSASDYPGTLPASWSQFSFWQYSSTGPLLGDSNIFNGGMDQLQAFANGTTAASTAIQASAAANPSIGTAVGQVVCGLTGGGCYRMYTNGAIIWSPGTGAQPSPFGPVRDAWAGQGYENGILSYPTSGILCGLVKGGCYQAYAGGEIFSSPATGAQVSRAGAIRSAYRNSGAENGPLGYPTGSETCGLVRGGCYQLFEGGAIIWSPSTGAQLSPYGPIRTAWANNKFETGVLGYPTGSIVCGLSNGGCYQGFEGGAVLYSPATGAQLSLNGPIRDAWGQVGYQSGSLGYPTDNQVCAPALDSCYQKYQGGTVTWTATIGARYVTGGINTGWLASGGVSGPLGYPTGSPVCGIKDSGCYQSFQNGYILWTAATGGQASVNGPIRDAWQKSGLQDGPLGYPATGVVCGLVNGGCYQNYQGGAIIWSPPTGAQLSPTGPIRTAWQQKGFETGPLGYPTTDVVCGIKNGGCYQNFQGGAIVWSAATGAQLSLTGPIRSAWQAQGFETGPLGYPTGPQTCNTNQTSCSQTFQGGKVNWDSTRGTWIG